MNDVDPEMIRSRRSRRLMWMAGAVAVPALLALGGLAGAYLTQRSTLRRSAENQAPSSATGNREASASAASAPAATKGEEAVEVTLSPDALRRAGVKIAPVRAGLGLGSLTVPGTVTSNAYRETKVNALVAGVVRHVEAELGAVVGRGQPLAMLVSTDLADAQMRFLSMQATFEADHQKLERVTKLTAIGAASRQELEEVTAVHAAHETEVAAARQRLLLLGLTTDQVARLRDAAQIVSEVTVASPIGGVVISRNVNSGQVVAAGQDLFVVADLSTVWVIGDLYEKDFETVRAGTPATVVVPAAPNRRLTGQVAYIDPRVDPATRTAKVRVEVPNADGALRLGIYVQVAFESASGRRGVLVPRAAVQSIGGKSVVYVATDDEGRFEERAVKLGATVGPKVEVVEGLKSGDRIVTEGSFFLRAEAARTRSGG